MTPKEKKKFKKMIAEKKTARKSKPFISCCMMIKNEEANLPRILKSINDLEVVDEICILDTGSADKSIEVAESFGAKVTAPEDVDQYFENTKYGKFLNFSKARNASIALGAGDWLLLVDADEEIVGDGQGMKQFLKRLTGDFDAVTVRFTDIQKGKSYVKFPPPRLFKNGSIYYEGIVHNSPHGFKEPAAYYDKIEVKHYGYDLSEEDQKTKHDRTLGLLLKRLEVNPTDFATYFYLAMVYGQDDNFERCIEFCVKYIRKKDQIPRFNPSIYYTLVQACMAADNPSMADKWLAESMKELPDDIDIAMGLIDYGVWQNKSHIVASACEKFIIAYDKMIANPLSSSSRFVYSFNEYALAKALFHLGMIRLNQGVNLMAKLMEALEDIDAETAEGFKSDMRRHMEKFQEVEWIKIDREGI